ncbi:hypothetical protein MKK69_16415 [Methylobacterium sp. J-026]|uniref:hypothetical protein n=1 Tax=Methylobacterium sp. J-026 TaxID=2836624 RepID=UPI001FBA3677|nr:hypothetical protein [Methylobacterium sp. J-026]MCJ2135616.1 hypothetical protein [Methylobacterium sp. J-026]
MKKNEAVADALSPARAILAACLAKRDQAAARMAALAEADRKLGRASQEVSHLSSELAANEGGERAMELTLALVAANARVAAGGSARAKIADDMIGAAGILNAATTAAQIECTNVLTEELQILAQEIEDLTVKLAPLHQRLVGIRGWAMNKKDGGDENHRFRHQKLMSLANDHIQKLCPYSQHTAGGTEKRWEAMNEALMADAGSRL